MSWIALLRALGGAARAATLAAIALCTAAQGTPERVPLYTAYLDPPLDAQSPGNLTGRLADWLSQRSADRYLFVAHQLPRPQLDAMLAKGSWSGAVVWANPQWFGDAKRQRFHWTAPYLLDADLLVSRRQQPHEYVNEGRSLEGLKLGAITGHRLLDVEWLVQQGKLQRVDAARVAENLAELKAGRLDVALVQAITLPHLRRSMPDLDDWLHIARQPRATYWRHAFSLRQDLRDFLDSQLAQLSDDPEWAKVLPRTPPQLRLVAVDRVDSPYAQALRQALDLAFERAGLRYSLNALPAERAFVELRAGNFDGDIARSELFGEQFSDGLRLDPAHSRVLHLVLTHPDGPSPRRWADLQALSVAIPRGLKLAEALSNGIAKRQIVEGPDACVRMVRNGRVQACLLPGFNLREAAGREAMTGLKVQAIGSSQMHLWLRAGLADEAGRLAKALAAMEQEGELSRLLGDYRQP